MKLQEFEKAVLKLAFETDTRITTASIAYYLGIASREANELLNELLVEGVLEFDSDSSGNLFYKIANHDTQKLPPFENLAKSRPESVLTQMPFPERFTTIESSDEVDAVSVRIKPETNRLPERPLPIVSQTSSNHGMVLQNTQVAVASNIPRTKFENIRRSPIKKIVSATPDGSLGTLSAYVIAEETRCDPRPVVSRRAELATCEDIPSHVPVVREPWFHNDTSLVNYDEHALAEIDRPEHQPGMALLLSLILPGTGQIYNNEVTKGVTMMVLCFLLWFVLLGWVVQIWSIVDAVVIAEKINRKPGKGAMDREPQPQT